MRYNSPTGGKLYFICNIDLFLYSFNSFFISLSFSELCTVGIPTGGKRLPILRELKKKQPEPMVMMALMKKTRRPLLRLLLLLARVPPIRTRPLLRRLPLGSRQVTKTRLRLLPRIPRRGIGPEFQRCLSLDLLQLGVHLLNIKSKRRAWRQPG